MSRVPILLLFTVAATSALGHAQSMSRTSRTPSLGLSRLDALSGSVVAADFNGDGIIDLAASSAVTASVDSTSGTTASTTTAANQASMFSTPTAAATTPNVAVFGNSVSVPNGAAATGSTALADSNTAVFGSGVTVPNATAPSVQGGAGLRTTTTPVPSGAAGQPNVAVFGNPVTVPNINAAVPNNTVTAPTSAFARGTTVPGMPTSTTPGGAASSASVAQPANNAARPNTAGTVSTTGTVAATDTSAASATNAASPAAPGPAAASNVATPETTVPANATATTSGAFADTPIADTGIAPGAAQTPGVDVSTAANTPGPVVVMLGTGKGTFGAPIQSWITGTVLAAGDFNRDRKTDLVVLQPDNQVIVMQGKGDGTFPAAFPGGSPVTALAGQPNDVTFAVAADVDGDGRLDLIVGANPNSARLLPGLGDFTFGAPVDLVTAESPNNAAVADINGDGRNDIVVAGRTGQALSIFLNQGALLFSANDVPLDRQATDVAAADLNRDGKIDLVVATAGANAAVGGNATAGGNVTGTGNVTAGGTVTAGGNAAAGATGETSFADGFVYVLLGRGDGTFAQPAQYAVSPGAWRIALGDLNRDGTLDIATANRSASADVVATNGSTTSDTVSILQGNPDGTFAAASTMPLASSANPSDARFRAAVRSLSVADVNGDQAPDVIVSGGAILMSGPASRSTSGT